MSQGWQLPGLGTLAGEGHVDLKSLSEEGIGSDSAQCPSGGQELVEGLRALQALRRTIPGMSELVQWGA